MKKCVKPPLGEIIRLHQIYEGKDFAYVVINI